MPLDTPADLRSHVALAIQVELSTIPPYLYAYYSIGDPDCEAAQLIKSVAAEEMLHVALASNLLLGLGGDPGFASPGIIPRYPDLLKHHTPPLMLHLAPCTTDVVRDVFMVIERPEVHGAPAETDEYETLGQFYHALEIAIHALGEDHDLFAEPQRERQMGDPSFYSPVAFDADDSGGLMVVDDVASACEAIEIIVHQGEGLSEDRWADPAHQELTHFHKYKLIADGIVDLPAVAPAPTNPKTRGFPPSLHPVSDLFNAVYRSLFFTMEALFAASDDTASEVGKLYGTMSGVMAPLARYLMRQPIEGGVAAPTFEVFEFATDDWHTQLTEMAAAVATDHPELAPVAVAISGT